MASTVEIDSMHRELEEHLHALTGMQMSIISRIENWKGAVAESRITFDLVSKVYTTSAERKRGSRCPVFPVRSDANSSVDQVWAGWHEKWICEERNSLDLIGVGWTFFWGFDGRLGRDQQILRADWDHTKRRGGIAAQPHWHLDTGLMTDYSRPVSSLTLVGESMELEELPSGQSLSLHEIGSPDGIRELDLSGMHLGMGGWENHEDHPQCWQVTVPVELKELVQWAGRAFQSARDQFKELGVTEIT